MLVYKAFFDSHSHFNYKKRELILIKYLAFSVNTFL